MNRINEWAEGAWTGFANFGNTALDFFEPTLRLGVTGLSGAGKTVFITTLIHHLKNPGAIHLFRPWAEGRLSRAYLRPQPDDGVARFTFEDNMAALTETRVWPEGTKRIAQLRLTIEYVPDGLWVPFRSSRLNIDIVDYPGEWLLDLPLLTLSFAEWSAQAWQASQQPHRAEAATAWRDFVSALRADEPADEADARRAAKLYTEYLTQCRDRKSSPSLLAPGRFLLPGDLADAPLLTFSPLARSIANPNNNSLWSLMERRYESYKNLVVKPFFRDHFARIDRQIILVDPLSALNGGQHAVNDLQNALAEILTCFRPGRNSWLDRLIGRKIEKILFVASKADHVHRSSHPALGQLLAQLIAPAKTRAELAGAGVDVMAICGLRATREAQLEQAGETLDCIVGTPIAGEQVGDVRFDGATETAIFPGDVPTQLDALSALWAHDEQVFQTPRFRPPAVQLDDQGIAKLPHIRLDRALNFLFSDRLT